MPLALTQEDFLVYALIAVCNAGYYRDADTDACLMCTDSTIKKLAGNEPHCNTDPACDGTTTVPNLNHTACGKLIYTYLIYFKIINLNRLDPSYDILRHYFSNSQNAMSVTMVLL